MYKLKSGINVDMFDVFDFRKDFYKEVKEIKKVGFDSVDFTLVGVGGYKNSIEKALGFIPDGLKISLSVWYVVWTLFFLKLLSLIWRTVSKT